MIRAVIIPIVEGHSEVDSVPIILRRILEMKGHNDIAVDRPIRQHRNKIIKPGELDRAISLARKRSGGIKGVLLVIDADDDCPRDLAPILAKSARKSQSDLPFGVTIAKAELEAWFLGSLESLRGKCGIGSEVISPAQPEDIRGAKEYLSQQMVKGRSYVEVDDQPTLAQGFDIDLSRKSCPSFEKLIREIDQLVARFSHSD